MTRVRPGWIPTLLLAFFATVMVVAFNRGEFYVAWFVGLGGSFLTMELWHAAVKSGDTFSEDWWAILGIRPPRASRLLRMSLAGAFIAELGIHIVLGGAYWFCGSWAIGGTAVPLACVIGYSLVWEGKVNWIEKFFVRRKLEAMQKQLQQSQKEGQPMTLSPTVKAGLVFAGVALLESAATYLRTDATPTLAEAATALGSGALGAILYMLRGPLPANAASVQKAVDAGALVVHNDDPRDPVVIKVEGIKIEPAPLPDLGAVTPPALKG